MPALTGWEDPLILPEGTWQDLSQAHGMRYIDPDIYGEVLACYEADQHEREPAPTPPPGPSPLPAAGAAAPRGAGGAGRADGPPRT